MKGLCKTTRPQTFCHICRPFAAGCRTVKTSALRRDRKRSLVKASLDPTVTYAVTQQAVAFAIAVGAEGFYTRGQLPESDPGRPQLVPVAACVAGSLVAVALLSSGVEGFDAAGLAVGLATSSVALAYNAKRSLDTKHDPSQWPGPKAWPAGMVLLSFFALNIFLQGLRADISF